MYLGGLLHSIRDIPIEILPHRIRHALRSKKQTSVGYGVANYMTEEIHGVKKKGLVFAHSLKVQSTTEREVLC